MKDRLIRFISLLIMKVLRRLVRVSDRGLARGLGVLEWILLKVKRDPEAIEPVSELRDIARTEPKGMNLLRNLLLEGRDEQFLYLVGGVMKHHAKPPPQGQKPLERVKVKKRPQGPVQLGLAGDHPDLEMMREAYREDPSCKGETFQAEELLSDHRILAKVNALEVAHPSLANEDFVTSVLSQNVAVSLHHACLTSPEMLQRSLTASRLTLTPFRVFYPLMHYPPLQRVKRYLQEGLIGEVCCIRVRATIGGKGGRLEPERPDPEQYLDHPAFNHFLLLTYLGGSIEKVTAYLHPMDPEKGGQGLVDVKFTYPGRFGLLECAYAPDLHVRSEHYPYDLEVEVAGSDGIIWMSRGMAKRTQTAPISVRVGQKAFSVGVECGLEEEWSSVYRNAAGDFLDLVRGKGAVWMQDEALISALALKDKVYQAAEAREVLSL